MAAEATCAAWLVSSTFKQCVTLQHNEEHQDNRTFALGCA